MALAFWWQTVSPKHRKRDRDTQKLQIAKANTSKTSFSLNLYFRCHNNLKVSCIHSPSLFVCMFMYLHCSLPQFTFRTMHSLYNIYQAFVYVHVNCVCGYKVNTKNIAFGPFSTNALQSSKHKGIPFFRFLYLYTVLLLLLLMIFLFVLPYWSNYADHQMSTNLNQTSANEKKEMPTIDR